MKKNNLFVKLGKLCLFYQNKYENIFNRGMERTLLIGYIILAVLSLVISSSDVAEPVDVLLVFSHSLFGAALFLIFFVKGVAELFLEVVIRKTLDNAKEQFNVLYQGLEEIPEESRVEIVKILKKRFWMGLSIVVLSFLFFVYSGVSTTISLAYLITLLLG